MRVAAVGFSHGQVFFGNLMCSKFVLLKFKNWIDWKAVEGWPAVV